MKRKGILLIAIVFMALAFQYANSDVCHAAGKKTAYGTVSENGEVLYIPKTVKTAYGLNMHCGGIYYKSLKKVVVSKENKSITKEDIFNSIRRLVLLEIMEWGVEIKYINEKLMNRDYF